MTAHPETERLAVRVPFRARTMPRGGKKLRETVHLAETAIEVSVVAPEMLETAVIAREVVDGTLRETRYAGFDGDLWLPLRAGGAPLQSDQAVAFMATGAAVLGPELDNPFWETGTRAFTAAEMRSAAPIEEALLRRVQSSDRDEVLARVARLAGDLLLCTDGSVWRRSVGPFLSVEPGGPITVVALRHALPSGSIQGGNPGRGAWFGPCRFDEAFEHASLEYGAGELELVGELEFPRPDCLPDHDALIAARAVVDNECASWIRLASLLAPQGLVDAGRRAIDVAAAVHGVPADVFGHRHMQHRPPAGMDAPRPDQLVAATEAVRGFFADVLGDEGSAARREMNVNWREHFETRRGEAIRRFDLFERDRLPCAETAPDFALLEGPRP